jgi:hypothetical protein
MGNTLHSILIRLVAYVAVVIAAPQAKQLSRNFVP